jgi:hypothetical protein
MISTFSVTLDGKIYTFSTKPIADENLAAIPLPMLHGLVIETKNTGLFDGKKFIIKDPTIGFLKVRIASFEEEYIDSKHDTDDLDEKFSLHIERLNLGEVPVEESGDTYFLTV